MKIVGWMKRAVRSVKPLDSIEHARAIMEERRINQLPVVVEGRLVGIVTDRDLRDAFPSVFESNTRRNPRGGKIANDPRSVDVASVMSPNVLALGPSDDVTAAVRLMRQERIGAVPIVDGDRLVGILTRSDVLDAFVAMTEAQERRTG